MRADRARRQHPALPLEQWPSADRTEWNAALREAAFLEEGGKAATWRPESQKTVQGAYGRWLAWLMANGSELNSESPEARITPERMRAYVAFLQDGRASVTVATYVGQLCMMVLALLPEHDWRWLQAVPRRLQRQAKPIRRKRERLVSPHELLQLALDLMHLSADVLDEETARGSPRQRLAAARDYRDGLIIALLVMRPSLRVKNLLGLEIGVHQRRLGNRVGLSLQAMETKHKKAHDTVWPNDLVPHLTRYLDEIRPMLIAATPPGHPSPTPRPAGLFLWVGQGGTALSPGGLRKALARHTRRQFGHAINPHLFRDCVATAFANHDPDHIRYAQHLLGHSSLRTTERSYVTADSQFAMNQYNDRISAMRKCARQRARTQKMSAK